MDARPEITTRKLLEQVRELVQSGYSPMSYLDCWLVGDETAVPKPTQGGDVWEHSVLN